ncbi:uncharacterized protein TNCV_60991 [Trichonephila clavipes]|nr:uncharacterized protein TNCV_60991 [Trichonephila clavipes]
MLVNVQCHEGTLNSRQALSTLMRLVEREERWEAPDHPKGGLPQNWGGIKQNYTVACIVLKDKANDKRINLIHSCDEFRGP